MSQGTDGEPLPSARRPTTFCPPTNVTQIDGSCFFDGRFHKHPFATDTNMQQLWQSFERYLVQKFPQASTLATPFVIGCVKM